MFIGKVKKRIFDFTAHEHCQRIRTPEEDCEKCEYLQQEAVSSTPSRYHQLNKRMRKIVEMTKNCYYAGSIHLLDLYSVTLH